MTYKFQEVQIPQSVQDAAKLDITPRTMRGLGAAIYELLYKKRFIKGYEGTFSREFLVTISPIPFIDGPLPFNEEISSLNRLMREVHPEIYAEEKIDDVAGWLMEGYVTAGMRDPKNQEHKPWILQRLKDGRGRRIRKTA